MFFSPPQISTGMHLVKARVGITRESPRVVKDGVMRGNYQLVFFTPELLIKKEKWRALEGSLKNLHFLLRLLSALASPPADVLQRWEFHEQN